MRVWSWLEYLSFDLCDLPFDLLFLGFVSLAYPVWLSYCGLKLVTYILRSRSHNQVLVNEDVTIGKNEGDDELDPALVEARRWFKQGDLDLRASVHDLDAPEPAYEWVCFKCLQAMKKATKATDYVRNKEKETDSNGISDSDQEHLDGRLDELVTTVKHLAGPAGRMLFPDQQETDSVPRDLYTQSQAEQVVLATKTLLDYVNQTYIHL